MQLPRGYNKTLQRAYPDCRMRWSDVREEWLLERRANYTRLDLDPEKYPAGAVDTFIRHRDGYYLAGSYPARALPPVDRLVAFLRAHDPRNLGFDLDNPNAHNLIADALEAHEQTVEEQRLRSIASEFVESGADVLMDANVPRSFVPASAPVRDKFFGAGKPDVQWNQEFHELRRGMPEGSNVPPVKNPVVSA